jgi:hypothetical protein
LLRYATPFMFKAVAQSVMKMQGAAFIMERPFQEK